MTYDDDPGNDLDNDRPWLRRAVWAILALVVLSMALRYCAVSVRAQDNGYLPPERYTRPEAPRRQYVAPAPEADPLEYYAEDWVVLNQDQKPVCRDPYIMRDLKIIKCISRDPVR